MALQFAAQELQACRGLVLRAVSNCGMALQFGSDGLKADVEVVRAAVRQNGQALQYADSSLREDVDVVLSAVTQCGRAFHWAAPSLQSDRSIVLKAVQLSAFAFEYATLDLQNDSEVFLAAVLKQGGLEMDPSEHKGSREYIAERITAAGWQELCGARGALKEAWQADRAFGLAAVVHCSSVYDQLARHVREDRDVALAAVRSDGQLLGKVPYKLRSDLELMTSAIKQCRSLVYLLEPTSRMAAIRAAVQEEGLDVPAL